MTKKQLAEQLENQIKRRPTRQVVLESANELLKQTDKDFAVINEIVGYMDEELQDVYILSEQFENQGQLSAMAYLHSIINQAQAVAEKGNTNIKK